MSEQLPTVIHFRAPARVLSVNYVTGNHWRKSWPDKKAWQDTAAQYGRFVVKAQPPAEVRIRLPFTQNRRRDPHNYVGTVCKWIVDGLVKGGVWEDDTAEFVTVIEPTLVIDPDLEVVVEVRPR